MIGFCEFYSSPPIFLIMCETENYLSTPVLDLNHHNLPTVPGLISLIMTWNIEILITFHTLDVIHVCEPR